jgi:hypothetical protein
MADPVKLSYDEYEAQGNNLGAAVNDFSTFIDPVTEILNAFGVKNPLPEAAEDYYSKSGINFHAATKVKFGGWLGTIGEGFGYADSKTIYDSMSPQELVDVGHMADSQQKSWLTQRLADIRAGRVGHWQPSAAPSLDLSSLGLDESNTSLALYAGVGLVLIGLLL